MVNQKGLDLLAMIDEMGLTDEEIAEIDESLLSDEEYNPRKVTK